MDGAKLATTIINNLKRQVSSKKIKAKLVAIQVGSDEGSSAYVARKQKTCETIGIGFEKISLPSITQAKLAERIHELNKDKTVTGILLQLPLPKNLNARAAIEEIDPLKDVDGITAKNSGMMWANENGDPFAVPGLMPCTGLGVVRLLDEYRVELTGKTAVVIGRSVIAGKPIAAMLMAKGATVSILHKGTTDLMEHTLRGDVLVSAAGNGHFIKANMVKTGAIVVDVGITRKGTELQGDVDPSVSKKVKLMTPVPGGVGPMTVAMLMCNVIKAHQLQQKKS